MNLMTTISALGDNYIYLYQYDQGNAFVVDPGDSSPVLDVLESRGLSLSAVLATHNHYDHVGGARELKAKTDCQIIGPSRNGIPGIDRIVEDSEVLEFSGTSVRVVATPGHTGSGVCYYVQPGPDRGGILFTGDTLFIGGCGRIFECDAETMWDSLQRIAALPDDTLIYPGHDYTQENYEFALTIEPDNDAVKECLDRIRNQSGKADPAVPSTIARERATNIFLRADTPKIKAALGLDDASDVEVFAELRRRKDVFG